MAIYYVDATTGSDSDTGLSEALAWQTIAKVNGETFSAGDSILFKKGEVWREELTAPSSGSSGNPITFGAYGSGALPIINGSDLITPGSSWTVYNSASDTNYGDTTTSASDSLASGYIYAVGPITTPQAGTVSSARVYFKGTSAGLKSKVYLYDYATKALITNGTSGEQTGVTANAYKTYTFATPPTVTAGGTYLLALHMDTGVAVAENWTAGSGTPHTYYDSQAYASGPTDPLVPDDAGWQNGGYAWDISVHVDSQANTWTTAWSTNTPTQIFFDGVRGPKATSIGGVNGTGKWFWASNVLYIYSTSDPDTAFTAPGIEVSSRDFAIFTNGKSYVTLQNLQVEKAYDGNIRFGGGTATNIIVDGCTATKGFYSNISASGSSTTSVGLIQNCISNWAGGSGIDITTPSHDWTIQDNIVHNNSQVYDSLDNNFIYTGGIKHWGNTGAVMTGLIIQRNIVYSNGRLPDGTRVPNDSGANGIWLDTVVFASYTNAPIVRFNKVYDNTMNGILFENCAYCTAYYNVVYGNVGILGTDGWGIRVSDWHNSSPANFNRIYNNTIYGNTWAGINVAGSQGSEANRCIGNEVRNNLVFGNGNGGDPNQLVAEFGGENDGTMGSGNVYLNNAFGVAAAHFIRWGNAGNKDTYAAWYSAYSAANGNTVEGDPLLTDPGNGDFTLQSGSPCIDAGVDVGLTTDYAGNPISGLPDIGAYEGGRTTKNTRTGQLGVNVGMGFRMPL